MHYYMTQSKLRLHNKLNDLYDKLIDSSFCVCVLFLFSFTFILQEECMDFWNRNEQQNWRENKKHSKWQQLNVYTSYRSLLR